MIGFFWCFFFPFLIRGGGIVLRKVVLLHYTASRWYGPLLPDFILSFILFNIYNPRSLIVDIGLIKEVSRNLITILKLTQLGSLKVIEWRWYSVIEWRWYSVSTWCLWGSKGQSEVIQWPYRALRAAGLVWCWCVWTHPFINWLPVINHIQLC